MDATDAIINEVLFSEEIQEKLWDICEEIERTEKTNSGTTAMYWNIVGVINSHVRKHEDKI